MKIQKLALCATLTLATSAALAGGTATVTETQPTGGTSINFGSSVIAPPASATFGIATFSGGAFLLPNAGVYGGTAATPPGSSDFWSIGISGANGTVDTGSITFSQGLSNLTFEWGSPDAYNTITFLGKNDSDIATFTGLSVQSMGPYFNLGDQGVTRYFSFSSPTDPIYSVQMSSPTNAFETANYSYITAAVPEPGTYLFMLAGLVLLGATSWRGRLRTLPLRRTV